MTQTKLSPTNPGRFNPSVDHIRDGYRRSVCGVGSIYYRLNDKLVVKIMRVLGRQDAYDFASTES